jgi:hypothetical protein
MYFLHESYLYRMNLSFIAESYAPLVKSLLQILVFGAKISPSECENMPMSKLLVYAKLYEEYINKVNESIEINGKTN